MLNYIVTENRYVFCKKGTNNMKKNTRRTLCMLTAAAVASSMILTGCNSKNGDGASQKPQTGQTLSESEIKKMLAYKTENIPVPDQKSFENAVVFKNGLLYGLSYGYTSTKNGEEYSYEQTTEIIIFDETGTVKANIPVIRSSSEENSFGTVNGGIAVDDSGNVTCLVSKTVYDPDTYDQTSTTFLKTYDVSGNEVNSVDMSSVIGGEEYVNSWAGDSEGNIYLLCSNKITVLDKNGTKLFDLTEPGGDNVWINSLLVTNSGKVAYSFSSYTAETSTMTLCEIDTAAKAKGKTYDISGISSSYSAFNGGGDYLFYARSDTGIIGVKPDLTVENVLNLLSLGVDNSEMNGIYSADDGSFYISSYGDGSPLIKVYPVDASEIKEKTVITLGCFSADWSMRSLIADFNKTNENYTIVVNSYSETNDTSDYSAAQTAFNNELLTGKVPDMLLIDSSMPYESYASKGLFTDLYSMIDSDTELTRDSFMGNVLTALETDGKLYSIAPSFAVSSYVAKPSHLKDGKLTLTGAKSELTAMGDGASISNEMTREEFVLSAIMYSDFIDYDKGSCDFDNDAFKSIIEYSKQLPETIDYDKIFEENPTYYADHQMDFINDKMLLKSIYLSDLTNYDYNRAEYGKDYEFTNFPTDRPVSTALINPSTRISISDASQHKEGAWEFIKCCLNDTVQEEKQGYYNNNGEYVNVDDTVFRAKSGMPILKDKFDLLVSHALDEKYYYNSDGEKVPENNTAYIGSEEVKIPPLTQEELDKALTVLKSTTTLEKTNDELMTILKDEISGYYAGSKSLDDTVSIIQSRANIYMSEHY